MPKKKQKVAFDVDETLIDMKNAPKYWVIEQVLWFLKLGWDVIIWSGGGTSYAKMVVRRLGFENLVRVVPKWSEPVDIAFDDCAELEKEKLDPRVKVIIKV